eukprot:4694000-Alexandrium_andersonii.AAC.1
MRHIVQSSAKCRLVLEAHFEAPERTPYQEFLEAGGQTSLRTEEAVASRLSTPLPALRMPGPLDSWTRRARTAGHSGASGSS